MHIAVIAAHGRSGRAFVAEALADGHVVHAGIRGENPFEPHDNLKIFQCDATEITQVTALIDRCSAVVSLIGHVKGSDEFVQTTAMKTIVRAMEVAGIKRLVSLTGVGVGTTDERKQWFTVLLARFTSKLGIKRLDDGLRHASVLERSDLDWTVLKVLLLSDGAPGRFAVKARGIVKAPTPRREVARAILQLLERGSFKRGYAVMTRP